MFKGDKMKGYKGFNNDLTCFSFQYEVGKTYEMKEKPLICERGFHFCKELKDVFDYYDIAYDNKNEKFSRRYCEVEALGDVETLYGKSCTNKIKIIRELSDKDICEILNINYDLFTKYKKDFNDVRINQIFYGLIEGLDVSVYAKPEFDWYQMGEIKFSLLEGLNVSLYAKPEFNFYQMAQIRIGLEDDLDVSVYAKPEFDQDQMEEIRRGLQNGLDISVYAKPEFNCKQMREIRIGLEDNLDISVYAKPEFNYEQMAEIRYSLKGEEC